MNKNVLKKISYGLFLLCTKDEKDSACIINTAIQVANAPTVITVSVSKENLTCEVLKKAKVFTVSILNTDVKYGFFENFGLKSGRDFDKFSAFPLKRDEKTGIYYDDSCSCGYLTCKVTETVDTGSHVLFVASLLDAVEFSGEPLTYAEYFKSVKPKPKKEKGFVCTVCGYVYEGDILPENFICPLCKHPASDFKKL